MDTPNWTGSDFDYRITVNKVGASRHDFPLNRPIKATCDCGCGTKIIYEVAPAVVKPYLEKGD